VGYRVSWTETAVADVERIASYIAKDSKAYAATFTATVRKLARDLDELADRGLQVPFIGQNDVREILSAITGSSIK
jgi:plasmid stabilization system protein ParE